MWKGGGGKITALEGSILVRLIVLSLLGSLSPLTESSVLVSSPSLPLSRLSLSFSLCLCLSVSLSLFLSESSVLVSSPSFLLSLFSSLPTTRRRLWRQDCPRLQNLFHSSKSGH